MQCFQKDPNLRVSARKLLKHPWIVSAKRTDSVVPVKPTKYDEAVKSVQEWNEALKSLDSGTLRRDPRQNYSASPIPQGIEPAVKLATPASIPMKSGLDVPKQRNNTEIYRSPDHDNDDNWDDDFTSSISPTALHLPHLKPVDNFAGMLSSEKLKSYATFETPNTEDNWDREFGVESTIKSTLKLARADPLETVRPRSPQKPKSTKQKQERPVKVSQRLPSQPRTQIFRAPLKSAAIPPRPQPPKRSSSLFREDSVEDYSDLIAKDDVALDQKFHQVLQVGSTDNDTEGPFLLISDSPNKPTLSPRHLPMSMI